MKKKREADFNWLSWIVIALFGILFIGGFGLMMREARRQSRSHSVEAKTEFQSDFPGLEKTAGLPPGMRERVIAQANKEFCSCRCGYTVAACLKLDTHCPNRPNNLTRIEQLVNEVRQGRW